MVVKRDSGRVVIRELMEGLVGGIQVGLGLRS